MRRFTSREEMLSLINEMDLQTGLELGVLRGEFSEKILKLSNLKMLYLVDAWRKLGEYHDISNIDDKKHEANLCITKVRMKPYQDRYTILQMTSDEAMKEFPDNSLDFVYIDASHYYEAVKQHLNYWYTKVRTGGIFCGHDYFDVVRFEGTFEVKKAVDEFAQEKGLIISSTNEGWCSWYTIK